MAAPVPAQPRDPAARGDAEGVDAAAAAADPAAVAAAAAANPADPAAAGDGAHNPGAATTSLADVPNPVAVPERPPLTFLGNVGNIALAFVASLLPSWEG